MKPEQSMYGLRNKIDPKWLEEEMNEHFDDGYNTKIVDGIIVIEQKPKDDDSEPED